MKKFSATFDRPIKESIGISSDDKNKDIKFALLDLMERFLTIRSYGSARTELLSSQLKIEGKEMFIDAIIDLVNKSSSKEKVALLESLKKNITDWKSIDDKIDEVSQSSDYLLENSIKNEIIKWPNEIYFISETKSSKITDIDYLNNVVKVCEKMENDVNNRNIKTQISTIKNVYKKRILDLC